MTYSTRIRRFRGSSKRIARIRVMARDKWFAALITLLCLLSALAGGWLGSTFHD